MLATSMTPCNWCGEPHASDQLCQRAQRGMTRRSFCFLFGAGLAAAALPVWTADLAPANVPVDAYTTITQTFSGTTATFRTRDRALRVGKIITVSLPHTGVLFNGAVNKIDVLSDGSREVHVVDVASLLASLRQGAAYPWHDSGREG